MKGVVFLPPIKKNLTTVNFTKGRNSAARYIVIHYTANDGDTAYGNTCWFKYNDRGASAHYFVDEASIYQCVADEDTAWHCGTTGTYKHPACRNGNSIGIELCSRKDLKGNYYFKEQTVQNAIELVKTLMKKYGIPSANVIRHCDVVQTLCPAPFVEHPEQWSKFKSELSAAPHVFNNIYRVAESYTNGKYINQKGAFAILDNAKKCCDTNKGTQVFDSKGVRVYPMAYRVAVNTAVLNVRTGPGTNYDIATQVKQGEVYTIVAEVDNWGKLLSGAGFVCLDYTKKL